MAWRVVLLVGVVIAGALGGASVYVNANPSMVRSCIKTGTRVNLSGYVVPTYSCSRYLDTSTAHRDSSYLRYAAFGAAAITVASIPLLRRPAK
jgi:hypothetical protein